MMEQPIPLSHAGPTAPRRRGSGRSDHAAIYLARYRLSLIVVDGGNSHGESIPCTHKPCRLSRGHFEKRTTAPDARAGGMLPRGRRTRTCHRSAAGA